MPTAFVSCSTEVFFIPSVTAQCRRFLQQCLAELLSLVIGKSQACALLKYDHFGLFGHIIPRFFLVYKRCGEKTLIKM